MHKPPDIEYEYPIHEESVWMQYNAAVNSLNEVSGEDYSHFCIKAEQSPGSTKPSINIIAYKQKLGGLISRLHGEYFSEEPNPLDGVPSTVIAQSQQQGQSVHIQMLFEMQDIIDKKIPNYPEGSKEKSFLQKLKDSLRYISNVKEIFQTIFKMAKDSGLNPDDLYKIFS